MLYAVAKTICVASITIPPSKSPGTQLQLSSFVYENNKHVHVLISKKVKRDKSKLKTLCNFVRICEK